MKGTDENLKRGKTMKIGSRVIRVGSGRKDGEQGTVIEATADRVRVKWDDRLLMNFYDANRPLVHRKGKRTWVSPRFLVLSEV